MSAGHMTDRDPHSPVRNGCEKVNLAFLDLGFESGDSIFKPLDVASQTLDVVTVAPYRLWNLVDNKYAAPLPSDDKSTISQFAHGLLDRHRGHAVIGSECPPGHQP